MEKKLRKRITKKILNVISCCFFEYWYFCKR